MQQDSLFKALSDPTRRRILSLLKSGDKTHSELFAEFSMSKPALTGHLEKLLQAELIVVEKAGRHKHYSLNVSVFEEVVSLVLTLFSPEKGA